MQSLQLPSFKWHAARLEKRMLSSSGFEQPAQGEEKARNSQECEMDALGLWGVFQTRSSLGFLMVLVGLRGCQQASCHSQGTNQLLFRSLQHAGQDQAKDKT